MDLFLRLQMASTDAVIDQIHYLAERARFLQIHGDPLDARALFEEAEDLARSLRDAPAVYSELLTK